MGGEWFLLRDIVVSNVYLYPLVILIITLILARTMLHLFEGILDFFGKHKSKSFNHKLVSVIERPVIVIVILIGVELAVRRILIDNSHFNSIILTFFISLLTYMLIRVGALILENWSSKMSKQKGDAFHSEVLPLLKSVTTIILTLIGVIIILQVWVVDMASILTSLGVVSVILGLAFQQTLANIFGGISLIMDDAFRQGDLIQLEDGQMGEVMELTLRSTKIKNFELESVIVPNGKLSSSKIINLAQPTPTVRVDIPVSVAYGTDADKVKQVLHDAMSGNENILKMPKRMVRFEGFGDSAINFKVFFFINQYKKIWEVRDEVTTAIYKALYASKIEIPFPIRTVVPARKGQYDQQWKNPKK